jgi:hypothetical protein
VGIGKSQRSLGNTHVVNRNERLKSLDDGKILSGKSPIFDGKNPWVSG